MTYQDLCVMANRHREMGRTDTIKLNLSYGDKVELMASIQHYGPDLIDLNTKEKVDFPGAAPRVTVQGVEFDLKKSRSNWSGFF